jgi:hypothetical protein
MSDNFVMQLQALLAQWDGLAEAAGRKITERSEPTAAAYYSGVRLGYEDCADALARLLSSSLAENTRN